MSASFYVSIVGVSDSPLTWKLHWSCQLKVVSLPVLSTLLTMWYTQVGVSATFYVSNGVGVSLSLMDSPLSSSCKAASATAARCSYGGLLQPQPRFKVSRTLVG